MHESLCGHLNSAHHAPQVDADAEVMTLSLVPEKQCPDVCQIFSSGVRSKQIPARRPAVLSSSQPADTPA